MASLTPRTIPYAPTESAELYPESDGKPMAETDLHINGILRMRQILKAYFAERLDVYVSGNIMMYYEDVPVQKSVSPDMLVSFGVGQKDRRTYKVWEEGKPPDFVLEFASRSTHDTDLGDKMKIYASIGISEYFLYDADRCYLPSPLMGFRLDAGTYVEISPLTDGGIPSETLGLSFHLLADDFGIYDPGTAKWLQTPAEAAEERAELAEEKAELAEEKVELAEEKAELAQERTEVAEEKAELAEERAAVAEEKAELTEERVELAQERAAVAGEKAELAEEKAGQEADARQKAEAEASRLREELARLKARM